MIEKPIFSSIHPGDAMTAPIRVVLHRGLSGGEWVTHLQNMQDNSYFWGHYHESDYKQALIDYRERCARLNVLSFVCDHCGQPTHTNENCSAGLNSQAAIADAQ